MSRSTPTHTFQVGSMPRCDGSRCTSQGALVIKILCRYHSERTRKKNELESPVMERLSEEEEEEREMDGRPEQGGAS